MDTPLTARQLSEIVSELEWSQQDLESRSKIVRTTISTHLSGKRPIRDEHLAAYIAAVPGPDKIRLLAAWITDVLKEDDRSEVLTLDQSHLAEDVASWLPPLNDTQRSALQWLADAMVKDRELDDWILSLLQRLGFVPPATPAA